MEASVVFVNPSAPFADGVKIPGLFVRTSDCPAKSMDLRRGQ